MYSFIYLVIKLGNDLRSSSNFVSLLLSLNANKRRINTWARYAFVVATATSIPASVYITLSASLAIDESLLLTIASVSIPFSLASFRAANVSAVSPDWDISITSVSLVKKFFWYLYSDA